MHRRRTATPPYRRQRARRRGARTPSGWQLDRGGYHGRLFLVKDAEALAHDSGARGIPPGDALVRAAAQPSRSSALRHAARRRGGSREAPSRRAPRCDAASRRGPSGTSVEARVVACTARVSLRGRPPGCARRMRMSARLSTPLCTSTRTWTRVFAPPRRASRRRAQCELERRDRRASKGPSPRAFRGLCTHWNPHAERARGEALDRAPSSSRWARALVAPLRELAAADGAPRGVIPDE